MISAHHYIKKNALKSIFEIEENVTADYSLNQKMNLRNKAQKMTEELKAEEKEESSKLLKETKTTTPEKELTRELSNLTLEEIKKERKQSLEQKSEDYEVCLQESEIEISPEKKDSSKKLSHVSQKCEKERRIQKESGVLITKTTEQTQIALNHEAETEKKHGELLKKLKNTFQIQEKGAENMEESQMNKTSEVEEERMQTTNLLTESCQYEEEEEEERKKEEDMKKELISLGVFSASETDSFGINKETYSPEKETEETKKETITTAKFGEDQLIQITESDIKKAKSMDLEQDQTLEIEVEVDESFVKEELNSQRSTKIQHMELYELDLQPSPVYSKLSHSQHYDHYDHSEHSQHSQHSTPDSKSERLEYSLVESKQSDRYGSGMKIKPFQENPEENSAFRKSLIVSEFKETGPEIKEEILNQSLSISENKHNIKTITKTTTTTIIEERTVDA